MNYHTIYIADLPQTVPTAIEAAFVNRPVAEAKALPQRRPPFVNAAVDIAAIVAVSAPGTLIKIDKEITNVIFSTFLQTAKYI